MTMRGPVSGYVPTASTLAAKAAHLTADMAEAVIARMDDAFTDVGACIGWRTLAGLHSANRWRSHDEG